MRIIDLISELRPDDLSALTQRVVPGAREIDETLWAHNLELVLGQTGHVEHAILGSRPPSTSLLLKILESDNRVVVLDEARAEILSECETWSREVATGEIANRVPDRSRIYRRMLELAWQSDLVLDASELRLLTLLRNELGLFRMEHFLLAHHPAVMPVWNDGCPLNSSVDQLKSNGVIFSLDDGKVALPDELIPHVRRALGVSMSRGSAARLLRLLDSGSHLRSALDDHEVPTGGSKQERIDRLIKHFVPIESIVDTMHISDVRELARGGGLQVSGTKEELIHRVIEFFACGGDLASKTDPSPAPTVSEQKQLSRDAFAQFFSALKGRQLEQLLLSFELRHGGTKPTRISTLWESPYSEHTLLCKLTNTDLSDILWSQALNTSGSKIEKIERLLIAHSDSKGHPRLVVEQSPSARESIRSSFLDELGPILSNVSLSSTSQSKFDALRTRLADNLELDEGAVAVKFLGEPKNYRNRIGEALRGFPDLLVLLSLGEDQSAIADAVQSRAAVSADTHVALLTKSTHDSSWTCRFVAAASDSPLFQRLIQTFPDSERVLWRPPAALANEQSFALADRIKQELSAELDGSRSTSESIIRETLVRAFGDGHHLIRTKHISDSKNVGNRISEAIGAGCDVLLLVVASDLAGVAIIEAQRQLSGVRQRTVAVVIEESPSGGYSAPTVVTAGSSTTVD